MTDWPGANAKASRGDFMVRRLLVGLVAAGLLLVGAPAFAQPPVTETTVQKNLVETFVDVVPSCEGGGPLYTITTTSNLVEHTTIFDDGRIHATFTQTGTFVAVPLEDPSLPSYTGKFTVWGGFNQNGKTGMAPSPSTSVAPARTGRRSETTSPTTSTSDRTARSTPSSTATGHDRLRLRQPCAGSGGAAGSQGDSGGSSPGDRRSGDPDAWRGGGGIATERRSGA